MSEPEKIYDFDPHSIPDNYLRAIGLMAMAGAQTESTVGHFVSAMLGIDLIQGLALTSHMTAPLKDNVARSLAALDAPHVGALDEIDDILDEINQAANARNVVVHNSMCIDPDTGQVLSLRASARGDIKVSLQLVSVEQIEQDALRLYNAGMALMAFMIKVRLSPKSRSAPVRETLNRGKAAREQRKRAGKSPSPVKS